MTDLQEKAMRMALDALEIYGAQAPAVNETIEALHQALAQLEQEPVAKYTGKYYRCPIVNLYQDIPLGTLLYTAPPKRSWVGLTDEDRAICVQATVNSGDAAQLMRAIEAKLKEKNT